MKRIVFILIIMLLISFNAECKSGLLQEVNILFLKENYRNVIEKVNQDISKYDLDRKEKKEMLYIAGLSYLKLGKYKKARSVFNKILGMNGDNIRQDAYLGIAHSYYLEKKYDIALRAYKNVLTIYPRHNRLSSIYYNMAMIYKAKNEPRKANHYLQKVKKKFATSFEASKTTYVSVKQKTTHYIVQLGAFISLRNAKKLVRRLSRKKFDSYIQKIKKHGKTLYRIRGGKFSNKSYARRLIRRLRRSGFQAKIIEE